MKHFACAAIFVFAPFVSGQVDRIQVFSSGSPRSTFGAYGSGRGQFNGPTGIAVNSTGSVLVVDNGNHRVQILDAFGNPTGQIGSYGSGPGNFKDPLGIAILPSGLIAVTDSGNHRVEVFDSLGNFRFAFGSMGTAAGKFEYPTGIAVTAAGLFLVCDSGNGRIEAFDSFGNFRFQFGSPGSGPGQLSQPSAIAVQASGNILVADPGNGRVNVYDGSGNYRFAMGTGQLIQPMGITVAGDGTMFVADIGKHQVLAFDSSGNYRYAIGTFGTALGQFAAMGPYTVANGANGTLLVSDFSGGFQPPSTRPVAVTGPNQTLTVIPTTVDLDGTASYDPAGLPLTYHWTLIALPAGSHSTLSNPSDPQPTFVADVPNGTWQAQLIVSDAFASSFPAVTTIGPANVLPPSACAGANRTITAPTVVQLDGSCSTDIPGHLLSYQWTVLGKPPGSSAAVSPATAVRPSFTANAAGDYVFQLVVKDGVLASPVSTVVISTNNTAPVANAGPDQHINAGALVNLDGSGSTDVNGNLLSYQWAFLSRPAGSAATLSNPATPFPSFTADLAGSYLVQLTVTDGQASSTDEAAVTTSSCGAIANPGRDQRATVSSPATLDGTGSHNACGLPEVLTHNWALIERPAGSAAALSGATTATPSFTPDVAGAYVAQLIVTGGLGPSAPKTVVLSTVNSTPVANPGANQTIFGTGTAANLDGSASFDADSNPLTYRWAILSRPAGSAAALTGATTIAPSFVPDVAGPYIVQLIVNDGITDSVPVTAVETVVPIVNVTIQSSPSGYDFTVTGSGCSAGSYTAPQTLQWGQGANCTVDFGSAPHPVSPGVQNVFAAWADGPTTNPRTISTVISTTLTANFKTQYLLTINQSPAGAAVVSGAGFHDPGSIPISATPNDGFVFYNWSGGSFANLGAASTTVNLGAAPLTITANFLVTVTIASSPAGLTFLAGGSGCIGVISTTPATLTWLPGSNCMVTFGSPQAGTPGTQYVFTGWADNPVPNTNSRTIVAPSAPATYTANFKTQYLLTINRNLASAGSVTGAGYADAGSNAPITATPNAGYSFSNWTGGTFANANSASTTVSMTGPLTITANFAVQVTIASSPSGRTFTVTGAGCNAGSYTASQALNWIPGSNCTVDFGSAPQAGAPGVQYVFNAWADGPSTNPRTFSVPAAATTYTANFDTQYQLTINVNPAGFGTTTGAGFHAPGSIPITATANPGFVFSSWSGGTFGNANNASTTVTLGAAPLTITANFLVPVTIASSPTGRTFSVSGTGCSPGGPLTTPQTLSWAPGSSCTVDFGSTPQAGIPGTQYVFHDWADGPTTNPRVFSVPGSATTYTADFTTQYQLTLVSSPAAAAATLIGGGFHDASAAVAISTSPNTGYTFVNWTGGTFANAANASTTVDLSSGPVTATANFTVQITIASSQPGLSVTLSGTGCDAGAFTTPKIANWTAGSNCSVSFATPQAGGAGTQYAFAHWEDSSTTNPRAITAPSAPATYTGTFNTQYLLTIVDNPTGAAATLTGGGYQNAGTVNISATANAGFTFANWTGGTFGNASNASTTVTLSGPLTITANFSVQVMIASSPSGRSFTVTGTGCSAGGPFTAPQTLNWVPGSNCSVSFASPQPPGAVGTQYVFSAWADGPTANPRGITAPAAAATFTANFTTQYQLTTAVFPIGAGTVTPATGAFYDAGTVVNLQATPANGSYQFHNWTGSVADINNAATTITMSGPQSVTANFDVKATVQASPAGRTFTVDSTDYTVAQSFFWTPGTAHTVSTTSPQPPGAVGTRYVFNNWSDAGAIAHGVFGPASPTTYTVSFDTQFQLTTASAASGCNVAASCAGSAGGSVTTPATSGQWFGAGTNANLTATANAGFGFDNWTGDPVVSSTSASTTIAMNAPKSVTANFSPRNVAPALVSKNYSASPNMQIVIGAAAGLLAGVTDADPNAVVTITAVGSTNPAGGLVVANADGSFSFDPPPGVSGNVTFGFTACDSGNTPPQAAACNNAGSVTVAVSTTDPVIWFVDPTAGTNGTGTLASPFNSLSSATAKLSTTPTNLQRIFVYSGTTASGVGVTLGDSQWLIGQGVTGSSFDSVMGFTPPATTIGRPSIGGTAPTLQGTVSASSASNLVVNGVSLSTGSLTAVNLANSGGTLSFVSISANGGSNGISLVNTTGSFTVTGDGAHAGSGGTISNMTGADQTTVGVGTQGIGLFMNSAANISLSWMHLQNFSNYAIQGFSVTNFTLDHSTIDGANGDTIALHNPPASTPNQGEGSIQFYNLLGTSAFTNSTITGGFFDTIDIVETSGTLTRLTIDNCTISETNTTNGGSALDLFGPGGSASTIGLTVTNSTFTQAHASVLSAITNGSGAMDVVIKNDIFYNADSGTSGHGVFVTHAGSNDLTFDIENNTFGGTATNGFGSTFNFTALAVGKAVPTPVVSTTATGKIVGNHFGTSGHQGSSTRAGSNSDALEIDADGQGTMTVLIQNNDIHGYDENGLSLFAEEGSVTLNATVIGNSIDTPNTTDAIAGIDFTVAAATSDTVTACLEVGSASVTASKNSISGAPGTVAIGQANDILFNGQATPNGTIKLPGYSGGSTDTTAVTDYLKSLNTLADSPFVTFNQAANNFQNTASCPTPP